MNRLKERFTKNGIDYLMLKRSNSMALFELKTDKKIVGYEVCRIIQNDARVMAGNLIEAGESSPSNEQFAKTGKDKAYFPDDRDNAISYFENCENSYSNQDLRHDNVTVKG